MDVPRKRGPWKHRLTAIDKTLRTATCLECGPGVRIVLKRGNAQCRKAHRAHSGRESAELPPVEGTCPLCSRAGTLLWDHDHKTGRGRGFICGSCNLMLGFAKDRPEVLEAGARHLRDHSD